MTDNTLTIFLSARKQLQKELHDIDIDIENLKNRRVEILRVLFETPEGKYVGPTGKKALPDFEFVQEMIRRRTALKVSASTLGKLSGYSQGYISMIENGKRFASDEAKTIIRDTLNEFELKKFKEK